MQLFSILYGSSIVYKRIKTIEAIDMGLISTDFQGYGHTLHILKTPTYHIVPLFALDFIISSSIF